jgi:hypothetical protein
MFNGWKITTRVSGAAVSRPLDPLVSRFLEDLWTRTKMEVIDDNEGYDEN